MDPLILSILAAGALALAGIGYLLGGLVAGNAARRRFDATAQELETLLARTQEEAEAFRRDHLLRVEEDRLRAETAATREREAVAADRRALGQEREAFRREKASEEAELNRLRQTAEARREKLRRRTARQEKREQALLKAADALDALAAEAEARRSEAEELRASVQKLAKQAGRRQQEVAARERDVAALHEEVAAKHERLGRQTEDYLRKLEAVTGIGRQEALDRLVEELEERAKLEAAAAVKEIRDEARLTANREARKVILTAIQRTAASQTIENTVSAIQLESDDMKGRIIGREGRNIRAFEAATGVEVVVDDTPEAVLLSGFDPVRREVARISMERLLADGRIHPARIEEVVEKTLSEIEEEVVEAGEKAVIELGLVGVHAELVRLVGRMRYRFSYGQNLLAHSVEVAHIASLMAAELGLDAPKARRAGLLHDIGKVVEGELDSPHALVGMEWAQRYREHPEVVNAIGAHHDEVEMTTPLAPLVQAADAISGARPGARREGLENYVRRLRELEALAAAFDGVRQVYAIQAGRELRVIVNHDHVSDARAEAMAHDISKRIEAELHYPGQIKVTVIREVRATAFAK